MTAPHESALHAAAQSAILVDRSSIGRIHVTGADRIDLLHRLSTNDLLSLRPGQTVGTAFTTDKGRMIEYVTVCVLESSLLLLTSGGNEQRFVEWVEKYHIMEDIQLSIMTSDTAMATLVGTKALSIGSEILGIKLAPNTVAELATPWGEATVVCSDAFNTPCVNLITDARSKAILWSGLLARGEDFGVGVMDADAWDTYRIMRGIPAAGHEIAEEFNPYDCGLADVISYTKGCYIGQEVIARLDTYNKTQRKLVGVLMKDNPGAVSTKIQLQMDGEEMGWLTSASTQSVGGEYAGLAIVKKDRVTPGDRVIIKKTDSTMEGVVMPLPITFADRI